MSSTEDFQMIMDFAEGNLDPAKEDSLFLKLSADEELRLEFKSHMALKNAMRIGAASVILPAASKAAVFSNLGLRLGGSGGAFAGFIHSLFNRKTIAAAGIILLLSTLSYVIYNYSNKENNSVAKQTVTKSPATGQTVAQSPAISRTTASVPNISSVETSAIVKEKQVPAAVKNISTEKRDIASNATVTEENAPAAQTVAMLSESKHQSEPYYPGKTTGLENMHLSSPEYSMMEISANRKSSDFEFVVNGSAYQSTSTPTIQPARYSNFNNMGVSLLYKLSDNFSIGANLRQETFFLRYRGTENNLDYIYEQQPNFTTFSALVNYKLNAWNGISPFAQVTTGINSVGFAGRGMLGLQYSIMPDLSFMLGFEYGTLIYTHQNNYFNSSKFGLNYGFTYSF